MYVYVDDHPGKPRIHGKNKGKKKVIGDCVIRAMQMAWHLKGEEGWRIAAERLFARSMQVGNTQCGDKTFESFLQKYDYPRFKSDRTYWTVEEFAQATRNKRTEFIVHTFNHLVFVKGGNWYDAWNSAGEKITSVWVLKSDKM